MTQQIQAAQQEQAVLMLINDPSFADDLRQLDQSDGLMDLAVHGCQQLEQAPRTDDTELMIVEARALSFTTRLLASRMGMVSVSVSLERYAGRHANLVKLHSVREGLMDMVEAAVAKVIELIKRLGAAIRSIFQRSRTSASAQTTRAKRLLADGQACATKKLKDGAKDVDSHALSAWFADEGGRTIAPDSISTLYKKFTNEVGKQTSVPFVEECAQEMGAVVKQIEEAQPRGEIEHAASKVVVKIKDTSLKHFVRTQQPKEGEGLATMEYKLPFGGKKLAFVETIRNNTVVGLKFTEAGSNENKGHVGLPILTPNQIVALAQLVEEEMTYGANNIYGPLEKAMEKAAKEINKGCDAVTKRIKQANLAAHNTTGEAPKSYDDTYSLQFLRDIFTSMFQMIVSTRKYEAITSKHILDWAEVSIKQYV